MRPGRELDTAIAKLVFGHHVFIHKKIPYEKTSKGDRPLRKYTKDIESAWEVVEKMGITLIPIENNSWFALVGRSERWKDPADFITFLQTGNFVEAGAAVGETAPLTICLAAIRALEVRSATLESEDQGISLVPDPQESLNSAGAQEGQEGKEGKEGQEPQESPELH